MINQYIQFVEPKEIIKDINYFYDQIKNLICNDLFGQYLYNKRKKLNPTYTVKNYLSKVDNTRLRFSEDTIIVSFKVDKTQSGEVSITKPVYRNYKIDGLTIKIDVVLTTAENKGNIIFPENYIFKEIRRHINFVNDYFVKKLRKSEDDKYSVIYKRMNEIKKSYYYEWNRLIDLVKECVNPNFNNQLCEFKPIIEGIENGLPIIFKMIHQTQFFRKYEHQRQLKFHKFIKSLRKECLDDNEIFQMTNDLAWCFGHTCKNYDDCITFLKNIINHFNTICYIKEMKINSFTQKIWNKSVKEIENKKPSEIHYIVESSLSNLV
jgi:hypothetical protein